MARYKQARKPYKLNHPEKYIGNIKLLLYKSSWEENVFKFIDNNPNIIKWGYEIIKIPYMKPVPGGYRKSNYFPDLYIEYFDKHKNFNREVLEIKPLKQTRPTKARKPLVRLQENYVFVVNCAKWEAAEQWCTHRGMKFSVITEKTIFKDQINK